MHSDYDINDKTNILIASIGGWLLIGGILQTIIGTIWFLLSKFKRRSKRIK
jgi:hypothetical protein